MQPLVPGFTITGELSSSATGSTWAAVRNLDDRRLALRIVSVADVTVAQVQAAQELAVLDRIDNEHVVRQHGAIALADGTLALVLDQVTGGSLSRLLGSRGPLSPGETITTVAPLFGALADLHAAGVVHGELGPGNVLFSVDGRPLISDLGVARLLGLDAGRLDGTLGFVAPELVDGAGPSPASDVHAVPSPASDVYAMAAIGWFCLTGASPPLAATRPSLTTLRPDAPHRLVEVLTSCLSTDPAARPSAQAAAVEVFDAAPAESVALVPVSDPASEITRRIRAAAVPAPAQAPPSTWQLHRRSLLIAVAALVVAGIVGGGATWFSRRTPVTPAPEAVRSVPQPSTPATATTATAPPAPATRAPATRATPATTPQNITDVVSAPGSPRIAAPVLLQALVDARALAYVARNAALLDLVYAPGATMSGVDRANIATALKNGATYLGLAFVAKDVAFLDGTPGTARIRATILTPAYRTGQPDGRKVPHAQDTVGPSVFTLSLTPDGWRILSLTGP